MQPSASATPRSIPELGEVFELTLNGDDVDPGEMVRNDRYPGSWDFLGPRVVGLQTRRFRLVNVGRCANLNEVREKAGKLAEGQWREAFRQRYPNPDGREPIGFGGSLWSNNIGGCRIPLLTNYGDEWISRFGSASTALHRESWRWLVEVEPDPPLK
jgi:hypothetical protein